MAVTKSWESKVLAVGGDSRATRQRVGWREFRWLAAASLLVATGLAMVYSAKTHDFPDLATRLKQGDLVNLNSVSKPADLLPLLQIFQDPEQREAAAQKTFEFILAHRPLRNVGALSRLRVPSSTTNGKSRPLLPVARLKPALAVRSPGEFRSEFFIWVAAYFAGFYAVFLVWRWSAFRGDTSLLPTLHLLTGIGLMLSISMRDPLRDTLEFTKFAWGVALGCLILLLPSLRILDYQRFTNWCYTPLFAAFALFVALLLVAGSGIAVAEELEDALAALKQAEPSKDPAKIKPLAAALHAAAQKLTAPAPADVPDKEAYDARAAYAKELDGYSEYALFSLAVQSQPPRD